jgi:azurin
LCAMRVNHDRSSKARTRIVLPDIYRVAPRVWAFRFVLLTTDHNCMPVSTNGAVRESTKGVTVRHTKSLRTTNIGHRFVLSPTDDLYGVGRSRTEFGETEGADTTAPVC